MTGSSDGPSKGLSVDAKTEYFAERSTDWVICEEEIGPSNGRELCALRQDVVVLDPLNLVGKLYRKMARIEVVTAIRRARR